jgi:hypothetical protein
MCIKLVQSGYFKVNDRGEYLYEACSMGSLELVNELLKCEPTEKTLLNDGGAPYDKAIALGQTKIHQAIKEYANRHGYDYSLEN